MDGMKLRELRRASGKTLRQISYEADTTVITILNIETNKTPNPGIKTLLAIAKAIGCKLSDFAE